MDGCLACDLAEGRQHLPGGRVGETRHWIVEHTVGPLGVGTLIVKPKRHVVHVADLTAEEAAELGPLLRRTALAVTELVEPDQVYLALWSHAGRIPGHIHWVVQPVTRAVMEEFDDYGPALQVKLFDQVAPLNAEAVEAFAERARGLLRET
jgi:diadenosine tetraphosphate (Ap4A) HIT family hydrolase